MKDVKRKSVFFTSDTHYGHANVIEFDERPFRDLEHMHSVLINNYNATVPKDGVCYFLGDVGFKNLQPIISQLNGTKIIIVGNHDPGINKLYEAGFSAVLNSASIWLNKTEITLSHCPLKGIWREDVTGMRGAAKGDNWHGESKHAKYTLDDRGQLHLHGHIHSAKGKHSQGRQFDVGVKAHDYRPVSMSTIESWVSSCLKS